MITNKKEALDLILVDGLAIKNCSEDLRNDEEIALLAIDGEYESLNYVGEKLKTKSNFMAKALAVNGCVLECLDSVSKSDFNICKKAINNSNGMAFKSVSKELSNNQELIEEFLIVMPGGENRIPLLRYAGEAIKNNKSFVKHLIESINGDSGTVLLYANNEISSDLEMIKLALNHTKYDYLKTTDYVFDENHEANKIIKLLNEEIQADFNRIKDPVKAIEKWQLTKELSENKAESKHKIKI